MGRLVKLIGSGIGLASEALAARKQSSNPSSSTNAGESSSSNARSPTFNEAPPQYVEVPDREAEQLIASGKAVPADQKDEKVSHYERDDDATSEEGDEEQWALDDAVEEQSTQTPTSEEEPIQDVNLITDAFMRSHPPPAYAATGRLPCPVILPQRRPRDKKRGFVRAYAPVLGDCGIDQATFLDFLKTFHDASKASPWLNVINASAAIAGMAPSVIAMGVSIAVQVVTRTAMEVQARTRSNNFLDRMNNEFFKPRGLYCLIMTYKPESSDTSDSVNITQAISSAESPASSGMKQTFKNLRLSAGKTYGELEMPEAAPLIFPALDRIASSTSEEAIKKQSKMKGSQKFVADYFDRRAQAKYAAEHPSSSLAQSPSAGFASRYSDPNHAANNGSLISLVTGGMLDPKSRRLDKRSSKRVNRAYRRGEDITPQTGKKREGIVKRMLKKDVLYLMIVNLPTDVELEAAKQAMANQSRN
ncbi:hypothetical protein D0Z07_0120 [Hyphodiscus hymeniophilus]|uniref:Uncharacterized protein n=1 Tax=Hyphodiscus hymeniophilus TaxID=353542 RepID=A0A9P6VQ72_9HELO|nr:hypothetical protein D0Z07_0120 [Hyphodiscus hymeniophilus]